MRFRRRMMAAMGALAATAVIVLATSAVPALATPSNEICGNYGNGYCLNDWNGGGSGNAIKMDTGNGTHEAFIVTPVNKCLGGDISTPTCPFANTSLDRTYQGWPIVEYKYAGTNLCVATNSNGGAVLGACPNTSNGSGGADGTLFVEYPSGTCSGGGDLDGLYYDVNRYWSDARGTGETLTSGGNPGVQAYLNYRGLGTCWGNN